MKATLTLVFASLLGLSGFAGESRHLIVQEEDLIGASTLRQGSVTSVVGNNAGNTATGRQSGFIIHKTSRSTLEFYFHDGKNPNNSGFLVTNAISQGHEQQLRELPIGKIPSINPGKTIQDMASKIASFGIYVNSPRFVNIEIYKGIQSSVLRTINLQRTQLLTHPTFGAAISTATDAQLLYYKMTLETLLQALFENQNMFLGLPNSEVQNMVIYINNPQSQANVAAALTSILREHGVTSTK